MSSSSTFTIGGAGGSSTDISIGEIYGSSNKSRLPNKKLSIDVHEAHGGYIVQVQRGSAYEGDLYIVAEDQDLGQEIGKIITHSTLIK
jgi:hypothetical protein